MEPTKRHATGPGALLRELRQALRSLSRVPGFSLAVILTLALAAGANAAVFSLVDKVLLSPLPYPDADRIAGFWMVSPAFANNSRIRQSPATYQHFARGNRTFSSMALAEPRTVTLDDGVAPERLQAALVTASLYDVLAVPAGLGRPLRREDGLPGAEPVAVLSHALWAARFSRSPEVVGRILEIDGVARKVVGILPPGLAFPAEDTRLWLPLSFDPAAPPPLTFHYAGYGRLAAGADPPAATRDLDRLIAALPDAYPDGFSRQVIEEAEIRSQVRLLKEDLVGEVRPALWILLGAVLAVLAVAAANLANLFAVRAESRRGDLAVRSALGAGQGRLLASLLAEGAWLAVAGTIAGLLLGLLALKGLQLLAPGEIPRLHEVRLDARVAAFTAGLSLLVGLVAGSVPALSLGWRSLAHHLRPGSSGAAARSGPIRLRESVVVVQVALALVLVVAAGLLVRTWAILSRVDPGFEARDVLTFRVALPEPDYEDWPQVVGFFHRYLDRVRALPGVREAAVASALPLHGQSLELSYTVEDDPRSDDEVRPTAQVRLVSEGYFATLGVPVRAGRVLERADAEETRNAVVINQAFAGRHWAGKNPVGRRLRLGGGDAWLSVVGVVGDVREKDLIEPPGPILYLPLAGPEKYSFARWEMSLAVRAEQAETLAAPLRTALAEMDRSLPMAGVRTLEEVVSASTARTRFTAQLLTLSALGALILGALGLYGVLSHLVSGRRREIGIRLALGAGRGRVRSMVVGRALLLSGLGVALGGLGAISLGRLLASQLYQVHPSDPLTLIVAASLLLGVAWLAGDIPARRAAGLDPAESLRMEEQS